MSGEPASYRPWGRYPDSPPKRIWRMSWRDQRLPETNGPMLPFGNGRSYGDSCMNGGGTLLDMRGLDRFIDFDRERGVLTCESGVLLADVLELVVPAGWFLPVTPGTRFVTVGGAIANDVHGKNHHQAGTFGCHVRAFELLRSDGSRRHCSADDNPELYAATIGGLGLTGVILWAQFSLLRIPGPQMSVETMRMRSLDDFFALSADSDAAFAYTVAWVDCLARGARVGRGWFMRANHASGGFAPPPGRPRLTVPFAPPFSLVNRWSLRPFNALYYRRQLEDRRHGREPYPAFFYPLDGLDHWNRLYGPRGFLQYQCVVPPDEAPAAVPRLLEKIAGSRQGSMLSVLKMFGDKPSPGLLSFPRPGATLALDFPNRGAETLRLLDALDDEVARAGGAVYPAKDARMSAERFQQYFPRWRCLARCLDPAFSSNLWRRATGACA